MPLETAQTKRYKTIDLCAGIGGIRRGFELTGCFENIISAEIDKYACITYQHLYHENAYHDLTTDEFKKLVKAKGHYDVLMAGFPCQTFSNAGKKLGFKDTTKGTIFFHIAEIIVETEPSVVFLENVDNLTWHNKGVTFRTILEILENELNYQVVGVKRVAPDGELPGQLMLCDDGGFATDISYDARSFIRNTKDFGLPQNRPRTYIIAFRREQYGQRDELTEDILPKARDLGIYNDLNDLLEMGKAEPRFYLSQGYFDTLKRHRARHEAKKGNFGYRIANEAGNAHPIARTIMATGGSGRERNLIIDIQDGIPGQMIGSKKSELNSECVRFMTPREWGKLQGFINYAFVDRVTGEDAFSFPPEISVIQQYKQFGNSVSIPVIQSMAEFILKYI